MVRRLVARKSLRPLVATALANKTAGGIFAMFIERSTTGIRHGASTICRVFETGSRARTAGLTPQAR
jgi:hypothetical protein